MGQNSRKRLWLIVAAAGAVGIVGFAAVRVLRTSSALHTLGAPPVSVAPSFDLTTQDGNRLSLDAMLGHGPAVLVFYRGHW